MSFFHNHTNIYEDDCKINYKDNQNLQANNYYLDNLNMDINSTREISLETPIMSYSSGKGWIGSQGSLIETDSLLRNARNMTQTGEIQQLECRSLLTTPKLIQSETKYDIDIEMVLRSKYKPRENKNCIIDHDFTENVFHPTLKRGVTKCELKKLVPEINGMWKRGGESSREITKNPEFLKKNGFRYNGKFWHKKDC